MTTAGGAPVARRLGALAILAVLASAACHRGRAPDDDPPPATTPEAGPAAPVDHLAWGELVEGTDHAFGLTLPRELVVTGNFVPVVYASGRLTVAPVVRYFSARLEGGDLHEGPAAATFEHVAVRGKPGVELMIHIAASIAGVRVEIRDTTPVPAPNLANDAERLRHVGLTPTGRVLDPTHLD
jgi:hypothetical protein